MTKENIKVLFATPCYEGRVTTGYLLGMLETRLECHKRDIRFSIQVNSSDALITRVRNKMVAQFLEGDYTHLFFIDADIGFHPKGVMRLLEADLDVVGGIYPKKLYKWDRVKMLAELGKLDNIEQRSLDYNINFFDPKNIKMNKGFAVVKDIPTGFICIKRCVFEKMKEKYPELKYKDIMKVWKEGNVVEVQSDNFYRFFDTGIDPETGYYLSEDYNFCRIWQRIGDVHADFATPLNHEAGFSIYRGDVKQLLGSEDK